VTSIDCGAQPPKTGAAQIVCMTLFGQGSRFHGRDAPRICL